MKTPAGASAGRRGVVLILTLFVILITYALVAQLTLGTSVVAQTTRNAALRLRMRAACTSAAQQVLDALADDAQAAGAGASAAAAEATAEGLGGLDPGAAGTGGGEEAGAGAEAEDADSFEDSWARPMRIMMGEIEIQTFVQDENSKFNLLSMLDEDEDRRRQARDRCAAILDRLRTGFDDDLDDLEAAQIRDDIVAWLEGRDRDQEYPRPPRFSNPEDQDWSFPYALEELLVLERIDEELFYDQVRPDDKYAPGLESVFTVWTSIDLEPPETGGLAPEEEAATGAGGEAAGQDPLAAAAAGGDPLAEAGAAAAAGLGGAAGGLKGAAEGEPAIGARINLNTAPRPVLEGMFESGFPDELVGEILDYRNEVDEEALAEEESEEYDPELAEFEKALYGERQEEPKLYFHSLEDLTKLPSFERMDPVRQQEFRDLVEVRSDVFSIYLVARVPPADWIQERRYQEPPGAVLRLRAVFWRRRTDQGPRFIPIQPWREVPYTRWRVPDFPEDLPPFEPPEYF